MLPVVLLIAGLAPAADPASERIADQIRQANADARRPANFAPPEVLDYTACLKAVRDGKKVYLAIGVSPQAGDYSTHSLKLPDGKEAERGRYKCFLHDGEPNWQPVDDDNNVKTVTAAEVRSVSTFRPVQSWNDARPGVPADGRVKQAGAVPVVAGVKSHFCPNCGAGEWLVIQGWNADGTHRHRCENCGTVFSH